MQEYTGEYYSEELRVIYTLTAYNGSLWVRYPRGAAPLQTTLPDAFVAPDSFPFGTIRYTRKTDRTIAGFTLTDRFGRVRNLRFVKAEIKPVSSSAQ